MSKFKLIAAGVGLFGAGAWLGWAVTADAADRKSRKMVDEFNAMDKAYRERASIAAGLQAENATLADRVDELERQLYSEDENSPGEDAVEIASGGQIEERPFPEGESPEETRENLQAIIDTYTSEEGAADYIADTAKKVVESSRHEPPFVITKAQYSWDDEGDEYAKLTLTYYEKHRTLLDEDNEVVHQNDIESLVGWRNLNRFGDESGDADVVFIRNRRTEADYEVVRETEDDLPLHVKWGMGKAEFDSRRSAGLIKFREEDV